MSYLNGRFFVRDVVVMYPTARDSQPTRCPLSIKHAVVVDTVRRLRFQDRHKTAHVYSFLYKLEHEKHWTQWHSLQNSFLSCQPNHSLMIFYHVALPGKKNPFNQTKLTKPFSHETWNTWKSQPKDSNKTVSPWIGKMFRTCKHVQIFAGWRWVCFENTCKIR